MSLPNTGQVVLSWPEALDVDGYSLNLYKNNGFFHHAVTTGLSYAVSGLKEGDTVFAQVYVVDDDVTSNILYHQTNSEHVDIYNFNLGGNTITFDSLVFNGENYPIYTNLSSIDSHIFYVNQDNQIKVNVKSPRDNSIIDILNPEPFFSGISFEFYSDSGIVSSGNLTNFETSFLNSNGDQLITGKFIANDIYSGSTTGYIKLYSPPTNATSIEIYHFVNPQDSSEINAEVSYNYRPDSIDYFLYSGLNDSQYFYSGHSDSIDNFRFNLNSGESAYLGVRSIRWGINQTEYRLPSIVSSNVISREEVAFANEIGTIQLNKTESGTFSIQAPYVKYNDSDSYLTLSIDSNSGSSYDSNSYFTGIFSGSVDYEFDYLNLRTGTHEDFYINVKLYQSGTNNLEDSQADFINVPSNFIDDVVFLYNYSEGFSSFNINSIPMYDHTGINILYSGNGYTGYDLYSGEAVIYSGQYPEFNIKMVSASDNSTLLQKSFSGSGVTPQVFLQGAPFGTIDSTVNFTVSNFTLKNNINNIKIYRKPTIIKTSGTLNSYLSGVMSFDDYTGYDYVNEELGLFTDYPPEGIKRNQEFLVTGNGYTGTYESGRHFLYKVIPENGFGTGIGTEAVFSFPSNNITISNEIKQVQSEVDIVQTANNVSNIESNVTTLESSINTLDTLVSGLLEDSVFITGTQNISGVKYFDDSIYITGSGNHIHCNEPTTGTHAVNKNHLDTLISGLQSSINSLQSDVTLLMSEVFPSPTPSFTPTPTPTPTPI